MAEPLPKSNSTIAPESNLETVENYGKQIYDDSDFKGLVKPPKEEPKEPKEEPQSEDGGGKEAASEKGQEVKKPEKVETKGQPKEPEVTEDEHGFNIQIPDETFLTERDEKEIVAFSEKYGLDKEAAQELANQRHQLMNEVFEDSGKVFKEQITEQHEGWKLAAQNDKEIGGKNFNKAIKDADQVLRRFGTQKFRDYLEESGLGDHPELIRVLSRLGKSMSNDTDFVYGNTQKKEKPRTYASTYTDEEMKKVIRG